MTVAIGNSLRDLGHSDCGEHINDNDDKETEQSQLTGNDEPGWVQCTVPRMIVPYMETFRQKLIQLDELTKPEWEDAAE
jgi:hypothetical protein